MEKKETILLNSWLIIMSKKKDSFKKEKSQKYKNVDKLKEIEKNNWQKKIKIKKVVIG